MRIIIIDDEPLVLQGEANLIRRLEPDAEVHAFGSPMAALEYMRAAGADVAFVDVRMPQMTGVELARRLKLLHPELNVIFTTADDHYYESAMQMHASGYILKPMREEAVRRELDDLRYPVAAAQPMGSRLFVRAFGDFEVFYDGVPLKFRYQKTKELLAYLMNMRGAMLARDKLVTEKRGEEEDRTYFIT
jgi:two-component SAPR family response regulator